MAVYVGLLIAFITLGGVHFGESKCSPLLSDGQTVITCGRAYYVFVLGFVMPADCKVAVNPGTTATFTCPPGYKIKQEYTKISCLKSGQWGKAPPTCMPGMNLPTNGSASGSAAPTAPAGTTTAPPPPVTGIASMGYKEVAGLGNVKVYTSMMAQPGARFSCRLDGGDLAYFKQDIQRVAIAKLIMNTPGISNSYFFVGAEDQTLQGKFVLPDASSAKPVLWCNGEPVNVAANGCMVYSHNYLDGSGCMRAIACGTPQSFICVIP